MRAVNSVKFIQTTRWLVSFTSPSVRVLAGTQMFDVTSMDHVGGPWILRIAGLILGLCHPDCWQVVFSLCDFISSY